VPGVREVRLSALGQVSVRQLRDVLRSSILRLKRGRHERARTHPWIFKADVADVSDVEAGDVVGVVDSGGALRGQCSSCST